MEYGAARLTTAVVWTHREDSEDAERDHEGYALNDDFHAGDLRRNALTRI